MCLGRQLNPFGAHDAPRAQIFVPVQVCGSSQAFIHLPLTDDACGEYTTANAPTGQCDPTAAAATCSTFACNAGFTLTGGSPHCSNVGSTYDVEPTCVASMLTPSPLDVGF